MFDSVAFEVVIGLVFIYLLYSLLVTILGEIISTFLGIRARLLRLAIERMLNDGFYYRLEKKKKGRLLTWKRGTELTEHADFRKSFAGKFYDYPAIKYLGRIEREKKGRLTLSKPSYISADYFASSLINFLADKGAGATLMDKVGFCLKFNTYHIQRNTLRQFINLFESSSTIESYKMNLVKWFTETMDRTTGWHKRKMRLIAFLLGLALAMAFNIDSIKIAKILANDKEARAQLVNMGVALAKDSARYNEFITRDGDTVHSQAILDTSFSRLKKDMDAAGLVLGLGWDFSDKWKADQLKIESTDESGILQQQVDSLKGLIGRNEAITKRLRDSSLRLQWNQQQMDSVYADTTIAINEILLARAGYAEPSNDRYAADMARADILQKQRQIILARMKIDSIALRANNFLAASLYGGFNSLSAKKFLSIDSVRITGDKGAASVYGKRKYSGGEKFWYVLSHILWYNLIGFLLTALALSMGAPFWFDMLNKLVTIRGAGLKPEEKKPESRVADDMLYRGDNLPIGTLQKDTSPPADVTAAAVKVYAPQIKMIPGVKSVFSVGKNGAKQIQVNVDNAVTKQEVERQFPQLLIGNISVPYVIVDSGTPSSHAGHHGVIANSSGQNGFGSIGCIVKRKHTGSTHILSCWHVLKGDIDYSRSDNEPFIIDRQDGIRIAERWAGGISGQFDYGLAKCDKNIPHLDNSFLKAKLGISSSKLEHRAVSMADVEKQVGIKYFNGLTNEIVTGFIYTDSSEVDINYIDKTRTVHDVLILTDDEEKAISKEGNSGSIVLDENNVAIAMIVGGDLKYTYAVKLSHVFNIHREMEMA